MQLYDYTVERIDGTHQSMSTYAGKVLLVVNTASRCGYTPQYQGLQELYDAYQPDGLLVLGFPCNQFGAQEPGSNEDIQSFCELNYHVTFPMFAKVDVNGTEAHPVYEYLKAHVDGETGNGADIQWNFTKFLISRDGSVIKRYEPAVTPSDLRADIEQMLGAS
ncbi:glutathione peroxidase [Alicyclobacillus sp. ALC3]|uniref:glutathione peroxidase n=1 Tax=Alicyclobacillus sp. ALC3 TaxID=2796143 RepID=UPI0023793E3A|nr:glutathione peroxidase [Alicyclobacillus sp. ALC3]WDL95549.1 glutathione peroxidase [Alicyclobacillus sp. ALC3]